MRSKAFLLILSMLISFSALCQTDKLYLHNGTVIDGTVYEVGDFIVTYSYVGEKTKQTISKYAVEKIIHSGSNREEKITDKILVNSRDDWEKVIILDDKTEITGLTRVDEVASSGGGKFVGANSAQEKSLERIKKQAAELKCPFVYLANSNTHSMGIISTRMTKNGVAYKY